MVKIRLRRVGAKKKPSYRLVAADSRSPRDGAFIDILGHYNPLTDPETIVINEEKARHWLSQGARPTETAARLLAKIGIIEEPEASKKKTKAGVTEKPEASKEEPEASITEEPEISKEEPEASVTENPKSSKEKT